MRVEFSKTCPIRFSRVGFKFTGDPSSGATLASTVVSGDADALVSRILTYPDLSLLADTMGSDGSEGGGSGGAVGEGITMYAVAPTPPSSVATPAAMTPQTIQPPPHQ